MNLSKLTIRCEETCEHDFKVLCVTSKKKYGEFLKELIEMYKQQQEDIIDGHKTT